MHKEKVTLKDINEVLERYMVPTFARPEDIEVMCGGGDIILKVNAIAVGEINVNQGTWNGKTRAGWGLENE